MNPGTHGPLNVQGDGGDGVTVSSGASVAPIPISSAPGSSPAVSVPSDSSRVGSVSDVAVGRTSSSSTSNGVVTVPTVVVVEPSDTGRWGRHGWVGGMQQDAPSATGSCVRKQRKREAQQTTAS